jgi:predicted nucleic acid-binding Zn ribbon protein
MPEYICPHCKQPINDDEALFCLYCGESLNREVGFMGRLKYLKPKIILVTIIVLILVSFTILMLS